MNVFTLDAFVSDDGEGYKLALEINPQVPMDVVKKLARELVETLEPMTEDDVEYLPRDEDEEEE